MLRLHDFIDVSVPSDIAYQQWLAFDEYPRFLAGVREVRCYDGMRLHWRSEAEGQMEEWDAEIVENIPPLRFAWRGTDGRDGIVVFRPLPYGMTRVFLEMDLAPLEHTADARHYMESAARRLHADLENFKERVELRIRHPSPSPPDVRA
jgi:uncharacterized membrane protein